MLEDLDPKFAEKVKEGDIIVAGENFGCGSSREHAPLAIKAAGVSCVIAKSFARIFYRNAINIGLPIIEAPDAVERIVDGDVLEIELTSGRIRNVTQGEEYAFPAFPAFIQEIIESGGLVNYTRKRLRGER